ncbi:MAG: type II toxin-antitoxin system RelE/ParE family toxin [Erysipelotrichaceae bacterium]|nr:type II toxin-antitoxin system RelE/ParE family toxin [Erysipelotrichaceae bacterium]
MKGENLYQAEYYEDENGIRPAEGFILSLEHKMKAKVLWTIRLLEEYGTDLRLPYSEHLVDGIFELRIRQSSNIIRILYFFYKDKRIIFTNGFTKKTQKTPIREIKTAIKRRDRFYRNEENTYA